MPKQTTQGRKGGRKIGRNAKSCVRYKSEGRREKNKKRKMAKLERKYQHNRERRLANMYK